ncbi:MAG TPA: hypothetical protein DEA26_02880 [Oceanospirillales bacterium]|nr:hypothetical protein [Oceanospirillaceae bacterium]HBS41599.1 hypothetical protein [Oceanospirillales bacterium]|tara:strand:+ start:1293 stop:2390 length:1098 start_codon:yes stop_codon:yes gene_type:complete
MSIRLARISDVPALTDIESRAFSGDALTARRFRHFIRSDLSELWCCMDGSGDQILAYALVLYHRGTSLARLYSIAVAPEAQGKGLAAELMRHCEQSAVERGILFMRLEVRQDNTRALAIYEKAGYRILKNLPAYYEDGADGWRLEKHLALSRRVPDHLPFYAQTTPFTCGPSALMMAMHSMDDRVALTRINELDIWREATTIYLTTGHGGCSPQGLALAADHRGFEARLWLSDDETPFLEGVRDPHKRELLVDVSEEFSRRCAEQGIETEIRNMMADDLRLALKEGYRVLLLISTYRLNRNKAPHWVWLVAMDDRFAYINDPDVDEALDQADTDSLFVPVSLDNLSAMVQYGRRRYTAAVLVRKR